MRTRLTVSVDKFIEWCDFRNRLSSVSTGVIVEDREETVGQEGHRQISQPGFIKA